MKMIRECAGGVCHPISADPLKKKKARQRKEKLRSHPVRGRRRRRERGEGISFRLTSLVLMTNPSRSNLERGNTKGPRAGVWDSRNPRLP